MAKVKQGDRVKINFTGRLEDGTIFDTTIEEAGCTSDGCASDDCGCETGPMEITIGSESFFPQIEVLSHSQPLGEKDGEVVGGAGVPLHRGLLVKRLCEIRTRAIQTLSLGKHQTGGIRRLDVPLGAGFPVERKGADEVRIAPLPPAQALGQIVL